MQDRKQSKLEKKQKKLEKLLTKQSKQTSVAKKEKITYKSNINISPTKPGEIKDLSYCPDSYDPQYVEEGWYAYWEKNGYFKPRDHTHNTCENSNDSDNSNKKFVIALPPPNVTGSLHIGHAMMASIQDVLIRYHRMQGFETLYVPGTDHAGIATQAVVEKKLYKEENKLKEEIGRENFLERVFEWKMTYGNKIYEQMKRMGSSLDFSRETFTLSSSYSKSVIEAFNILYEQNLIYRESKMVNWSGKMKTTLSDLEVNHEEIKGGSKIVVDGNEYVFGVLYYFKYPIIKFECKDNDIKKENMYYCGEFDTFINVSTTRPETILGDSAVCVNVKDDRVYLKDYCAVNPLTRKIIPIIYDDACDMSFGTGALKITPSHDHTDYEIGKRHRLEFINILTQENKITIENIANTNENIENVMHRCRISNDNILDNTKFITQSYLEIPEKNRTFIASLKDVKRFDARKSVIKFLKDNNMFVKEDFVNQTLPFCSRSNDIIEPMIKKQWWMKCKEIGKKAGDAVRNGEIDIHPPECKKVWYNWVDNIRDWCLSRQLWWGHRIPAWRLYKNDKFIRWEVARNVEEIIERIKKEDEMKQNTKNTMKSSNDKIVKEVIEQIKKEDEMKQNTKNTKESSNDKIVEEVIEQIKKEDEMKQNTKNTMENTNNNNDTTFSAKNTVDIYNFRLNNINYTLKQDEDVLDTWFSSGLWPFAIFEWPSQTRDLSKYFPNTLLETGYDILFFG